MSRLSCWMFVCALSLACLLSACERSSSASATPASLEKAELSPASTQAPPTATPSAPRTPREPLTPQNYAAQLTDAACQVFTSCQNQELQMAVTSTLMLIGMAGSMEKSELAERLQTIVEAVHQRDPKLPDQEQCRGLFGIVFDMAGMNPADLERKIGAGHVRFNAEQATRCLMRFDVPLDACLMPVPAGDMASEEQFSEVTLKYEGILQLHFEACQDILEGTLAQGAECSHDFECQSPMVCQSEPGGGASTCQREW